MTITVPLFKEPELKAIVLRDYQQRGINFCNKTDNNGLIQAPTGAGKSILIAELIETRPMETEEALLWS